MVPKPRKNHYYQSIASELLGNDTERELSLLFVFGSGMMRKFLVIIVTLQRRKGAFCNAHPSEASGAQGTTDSSLNELLSRGWKLRSLLLAFVALGALLQVPMAMEDDNVPVWPQGALQGQERDKPADLAPVCAWVPLSRWGLHPTDISCWLAQPRAH